jgi:hypothetical protein
MIPPSCSYPDHKLLTTPSDFNLLTTPLDHNLWPHPLNHTLLITTSWPHPLSLDQSLQTTLSCLAPPDHTTWQSLLISQDHTLLISHFWQHPSNHTLWPHSPDQHPFKHTLPITPSTYIPDLRVCTVKKMAAPPPAIQSRMAQETSTLSTYLHRLQDNTTHITSHKIPHQPARTTEFTSHKNLKQNEHKYTWQPQHMLTTWQMCSIRRSNSYANNIPTS